MGEEQSLRDIEQLILGKYLLLVGEYTGKEGVRLSEGALSGGYFPLRAMCYTCVVFNKPWVQVLDIICFEDTYFGSVGAFERKKMNVRTGGT